MRIRIIRERRIEDVDSDFARRMTEQGKAEYAEPEAETAGKAEAEEKTEAVKAEEKAEAEEKTEAVKAEEKAEAEEKPKRKGKK